MVALKLNLSQIAREVHHEVGKGEVYKIHVTDLTQRPGYLVR